MWTSCGCLRLPEAIWIYTYMTIIFKHLLTSQLANQSQILCGASLKIFINSLGHMNKMTARTIDGKNFPTKIFSRTKSPMTLTLGMQYWELKHYKVYLNDDPGLTMTCFTLSQNLVACVFE